MKDTPARIYPQLRASLLCLPLVLGFTAQTAAQTPGQVLVDRYVEAWVEFYPSAAFAYGDITAAAAFESFDAKTTARWLKFNKATAQRADTLLAEQAIDTSAGIDLQILLGQTQNELAYWREDQPLTEQPQWYAEQVSQAITHLLVREQLPLEVRSAALVKRLAGVQQLCDTGATMLVDGNALRIESALHTLENSRVFFAGHLRTLTAAWPQITGEQSVDMAINRAVEAIQRLEIHMRERLLPQAATSPGIGAVRYSAKLHRRTSGLYTPSALLAAAGREMREVHGLMIAQALRWRQLQPDANSSGVTGEENLAAAIEAMEADRQQDQAGFLASFQSLTLEAEQFVAEQQLATVPKPTTLIIALSPAHFSGAAVGGVYPTGPFSPGAETLFYVPSIPDSAPPEEKEGFYRSFNTHFNTMIMSHEMFPGHYLQYKVAVMKAPALRSLFANGSYVEGWGSFSEELMLDAGWAGDSPLARLAHLRKRLENATRAYVSVQVNTAQWGEAEVLAFARDEGLLAPQFAKNLWQRVVNSPLQITDYFTGYQHFKRLFTEHKAKPETGDTRTWVDAVLGAGPIPLPMLESVL
jgi:uncharacterized protein (DUF885 family)